MLFFRPLWCHIGSSVISLLNNFFSHLCTTVSWIENTKFCLTNWPCDRYFSLALSCSKSWKKLFQNYTVDAKCRNMNPGTGSLKTTTVRPGGPEWKWLISRCWAETAVFIFSSYTSCWFSTIRPSAFNLASRLRLLLPLSLSPSPLISVAIDSLLLLLFLKSTINILSGNSTGHPSPPHLRLKAKSQLVKLNEFFLSTEASPWVTLRDMDEVEDGWTRWRKTRLLNKFISFYWLAVRDDGALIRPRTLKGSSRNLCCNTSTAALLLIWLMIMFAVQLKQITKRHWMNNYEKLFAQGTQALH